MGKKRLPKVGGGEGDDVSNRSLTRDFCLQSAGHYIRTHYDIMKDFLAALDYRLKASAFSSYALRTIGPLRLKDQSRTRRDSGRRLEKHQH